MTDVGLNHSLAHRIISREGKSNIDNVNKQYKVMCSDELELSWSQGFKREVSSILNSNCLKYIRILPDRSLEVNGNK